MDDSPLTSMEELEEILNKTQEHHKREYIVFELLDNFNIRRGYNMLIAGWRDSGKQILVMNMIKELLRKNLKILYFTTEPTYTSELFLTLMCEKPLEKVTRQDTKTLALKYKEQFKILQLLDYRDIEKLKQKITEQSPDVYVIDVIEALEPIQHLKNRTDELFDIVGVFAAFSKKTNLVGILLSIGDDENEYGFVTEIETISSIHMYVSGNISETNTIKYEITRNIFDYRPRKGYLEFDSDTYIIKSHKPIEKEG